MRWSLVILSVAFAACFEAGPLEVAHAPLDHDTASDTGTIADAMDDAEVASDTTTTDDIIDIVDSDVVDSDVLASEVSDSVDASGDSDSASPDVTVPACLIDGDCADVSLSDRCAGVVRCIDYGCRPDPATAVTCEEPVGATCTATRCNPDTGVCESFGTCTCETDGVLACGQTLEFSTNDLGPHDRFSAYGCGPAAGSWKERLSDFVPPAGRVRLDLVSSGTAGMHVLALADDQCDPIAGCLTGAVSRLYFDASGAPLVVAVDYSLPDSLVRLTATCGIVRESACGDGFDDDGDGATDCADGDCDGVGDCPHVPTSEAGLCSGQVDDDGDGATDCDDSDCDSDAKCLETCEVTTVSVGCGFHQGAPNGGGKANATHYACTPVPAPGREIAYRFRPSFSGTIDVAFSAEPGLALYLLEDTGRGCTPRDCLATSTTGLSFQAVENTTYYFAIDAPSGVIGNYDLHVTCPD